MISNTLTVRICYMGDCMKTWRIALVLSLLVGMVPTSYAFAELSRKLSWQTINLSCATSSLGNRRCVLRMLALGVWILLPDRWTR